MLERLLDELPRFFSYYNVVFLLQAMGSTLLLTVLGCGVGFLVGLPIAVLRLSRHPLLLPFRFVAIVYVELFRRIPFLVILYLVLFGLPAVAPNPSLWLMAVVAICLLSTAFLSEIIRGALASVPPLQIEAAHALNFGWLRTLRYVILPQSWRIMLPPAVAFAVMFIKDTALASQMGVFELTFAGKSLVNSRGFSTVLGYGAILVGYFLLSYPLSRLGAYLETRLATPRSQKPGLQLRVLAGPQGYQPVG